jgi:voltage-gated potassium channel Kch
MAAVVYLVNDLLFTSKIRETALQLGLDVQAVRTPADVPAATAAARVLIVDLRRPDALAALEAAAAGVTRIGFVDHERVDIMEAARERGCTALAKGKFSSDLPRLLSRI